jgi:O-succinylbenzoic acid--CoA ligase
VPELVALDLPQDARLAAALEVVWARGDAACVLDRRLPAPARRLQLDALRPTRVLDLDGEHRLEGGLGVEAGDGLCVMTSGSTSDPKAAVLTRAAVEASAEASTVALGIDPGRHAWLCCLPCSHIGGLSVLTRSLLSGTKVEVLERAEPASLERAAARGASHVSLVATVLGRIDASWFDRILLGGAAPPTGLPENVVSTYGMTETGSGVVYDGVALEGVELAIARPDPAGLGQILVRGPMLLRSYRDRPAPIVDGPDGSGGWLATGDLGRLGAGHRLEVRGRLAEVIVTGAEKVFPADVEAVLSEVAGVGEVGVWKRADPEWGERVVAFVVPSGEAPSLESLRAAVGAQLGSHCAPRELVLLERLPRTASGKLRRSAL